MKKSIEQLNWQEILQWQENSYCIGNDFILFDKAAISTEFKHPFRVDVLTAIICTKGLARGRMNLKPYTSTAPCLIIVMHDMVLEYEYISEDFEGLFIVISKQFLSSLNIQNGFSTFMAVHSNLSIPLCESELESILGYYAMMQHAIKVKDNPYRLEIAKNLTKAFFYGIGYYLHKLSDNKQKNKNEQLVDDFMNLVQLHFKTQRGVEFYADKLCITPKYMSTIIKQTSGKSAGEWIDERILLEVKVLLKSTNMTIQQIADELNFPTQSSFGKYFKRLIGMSPKSYRLE